MKKKVLLICSALVVAGCAKKSDLENAKMAIEALRAENAELKAILAKKPKIPVSMSFRKALTGPGYVAVFNTTVKSQISVLAVVKSAALGTSKRFELHLDGSLSRELGHLEGAVIEAGDTVTLENNNYSPITFSVGAQ